ncbi:MAG: sigma 54-interacting transcriptional regulator [Deltaproteobacteria bacterium]|nr:sigma 54-interacting transcriptional regulator [Deltaproteobacteria bacterium]
MYVDERDFFREFSLRICGSLNIEKALYDCFTYVRELIPADELALVVYDPPMGAVEVVASAGDKGGEIHAVHTVMPPEIRKEIEAAGSHPRIRVANDIRQDPIAGRIAKTLGWPDSSVMVGRLMIEGKLVGAIYARAGGKGMYTEEHVRLWAVVNEPAAVALANSQRFRELTELKDILADDSQYFQEELRKITGEEIIGVDFGLKDVMDRVRHVAPLSSPVLLMGETGTGKEVIANAVHNLSPRRDGPFIKVNCGGIPESLVDSELFGHEKGAFTGALSQRRGRFERAHGGTIFLDEVGELPHSAQVRLLRVLQEKEIERVGGSSVVKVDIRVISATHRDLEKLIVEGHFRDDLYFRLKVFPIGIPPLRERKADIPVLVQHVIRRKSREMGLHRIPMLAAGAIDWLLSYEWPGNVRELENAVERALILSDGEPLNFEEILPPTGRPEPTIPLGEERESLRLDVVESMHIRKVLNMVGGRVEGKNGAAEMLGIHPGTLRHRMRKLGIPFGRKACGKGMY